jgi:hypothetical protein
MGATAKSSPQAVTRLELRSTYNRARAKIIAQIWDDRVGSKPAVFYGGEGEVSERARDHHRGWFGSEPHRRKQTPLSQSL